MLLPLLTAALLAAGAALDHEAIHKLYADGELDKARGILEDFQRANSTWSREDSLFLYKYLGVIHSHRKETREKGKAYFYKLLKADPEARILDMYASVAVQEIFQDAKQELDAAMAGPGGDKPDTAAAAKAKAAQARTAEAAPLDEKRVVARFETVPPAEGKQPSTWSGTGRTWIWVGAAGLGVTGAVIGYHYLVDNEVPKDRIISLND
jgi:hypothetical protein